MDGNPRTLANGVATKGGGSNMTVALCTSACSAAGYTLAGMEYAGEVRGTSEILLKSTFADVE